MRSGKLKSKHDDLIRTFILDPLYDVRNDGTVWTVKTVSGKVSLSRTWRKAGRIETNGYTQISYRGRRLLVQRIVYQKFNGTLKNDLVVDHINGDRQDNRPENLRLITAKTNSQYKERRLDERERTSVAA